MTNGIITILISDSNIQALAGIKQAANVSEYKVFPLVVTEGTKPPYIVVRTISKPPIPCKGTRVSSFQPTAQVSCYCKTFEEALALEAAVIDALDNKSAGTYNGINISYLRYVDRSEDWIPHNDGVGLFITSPQFEAQTNESTPT